MKTVVYKLCWLLTLIQLWRAPLAVHVMLVYYRRKTIRPSSAQYCHRDKHAAAAQPVAEIQTSTYVAVVCTLVNQSWSREFHTSSYPVKTQCHVSALKIKGQGQMSPNIITSRVNHNAYCADRHTDHRKQYHASLLHWHARQCLQLQHWELFTSER